MRKIKISNEIKLIIVLVVAVGALIPFLINFLLIQSDAFQTAKTFLLASQELSGLMGEPVESVHLYWRDGISLEMNNNNGNKSGSAFFAIASKGHSRELLVYTTLKVESGYWVVKSATTKINDTSEIELMK
ncbi:hypothetical protein [Undibacterium hunanense]|uniref:hypothetical protein n=1 Tax=Undibacterium hunanense TaxID=2762292 RepID=UPI00164A37F5|nr:hypothetical protein [Undibacterium hunanense]